MKPEKQDQSNVNVKWLSVIGLLIILYLMYSSAFLSDYLMNDERAYIGGISWKYLSAMKISYFRYGRGLFGLYQKLVYDFAGYDAARVQSVRFINFLSLALAAAYLLIFLGGKLKNKYISFIAILFFMSQPAVQVLMGYSLQLISNSQPSIWLSLLAFHLFFLVLVRSRLPAIIQAGIAFVILILAMQSTQTYAFFALIPLSILMLREWNNEKRRSLLFLLVILLVLGLSATAFKISSTFLKTGISTYGKGEESLSQLLYSPWNLFLFALNPLSYWNVFKIWTFPFPFQNTLPISTTSKMTGSMLIMLIWMAMIFAAIWLEMRRTEKRDRPGIIFKWLAVTCCFGLAAVVVIADSPLEVIEHRPHVLLVFSGLVVVTGAYALDILTERAVFLRSAIFKVLISILVMTTAFGAQSDFLRNIVNVHVKQLDFMRSELSVRASDSYNTVIVVLPSWLGCISEPCSPWYGWSTDSRWQMSRPAAYRYALVEVGVDQAEKRIVMKNKRPAVIPQDAICIDWEFYSAAQQNYAGYFSEYLQEKTP